MISTYEKQYKISDYIRGNWYPTMLIRYFILYSFEAFRNILVEIYGPISRWLWLGRQRELNSVKVFPTFRPIIATLRDDRQNVLCNNLFI